MKRSKLLAAQRAASRSPYIHRSTLMRVAGISEEDQFRELAAFIKDEAPFEFWPVYERPGWWTRNPSEEIRIVAAYEAAQRNCTEQERNLAMLQRHRSGTMLYGISVSWVGQLQKHVDLLRLRLPDPDREDFCLMGIDRLIESEA